MSTFTCLNCKKEIPIEEKIKHELYCSAIKNNEYDNLIPCEYCNEFVSFDEYSAHVSQCYSANSFNLINFIENINNNNGNDNGNDNGTEQASIPIVDLNGVSIPLNQIFGNLINTLNEQQQDNHDNYEYLTNLGNTMGNVDNGIEDIDKISKKIESLELLKCPICMKKNTEFRKTVCKHIFCEPCLSKWLETNKKCPICMINLDEIKK